MESSNPKIRVEFTISDGLQAPYSSSVTVDSLSEAETLIKSMRRAYKDSIKIKAFKMIELSF